MFLQYQQRQNCVTAPQVLKPFQLAQASPENGRSAFAGSPRHHGGSRSLGSAADNNDADSPAATLESVYSLVKECYVDALPDDRALSHGAVRSLLSALHDPNAFFLDPGQIAIVDGEAQGRFFGIGAVIDVRSVSVNGYTERKIEIVSALPGSPAEKAGLRPHDVITRIDGKWILGSDPSLKVDSLAARLEAEKQDSNNDEVAREADESRRRASGGIGLVRAQMALRGDVAALGLYHLPTDILKLTVISQDSPTPRMVDVEPGETDAFQPQVSIDPSGITLIRIPAFNASTFEAVARALRGAPSTGTGIILDLRQNSGGLSNGMIALQAAQNVDSLLCSAGAGPAPVFAVEELAGGRLQTLRAATGGSGSDKGSTCSLAPIVVLVDSGTAGVAEALAAALGDSGRATIVGQQTFGLANVQGIYRLPDGSGFVLPTGQLSSPKRVEWAGLGLKPSVRLPTGLTDAQVTARAVTLLAGNARIAAAPPHLH